MQSWDTHRKRVIDILIKGLNRGETEGKVKSLVQNNFEIQLCKFF